MIKARMVLGASVLFTAMAINAELVWNVANFFKENMDSPFSIITIMACFTCNALVALLGYNLASTEVKVVTKELTVKPVKEVAKTPPTPTKRMEAELDDVSKYMPKTEADIAPILKTKPKKAKVLANEQH